jgi:hypothetical protein
MAAYQKFLNFPSDFLMGLHNFDVDDYNIMLTNTLPNAALDTVYDDIFEIPAVHGYPAGGLTIENLTLNLIGEETIVKGNSVIFIATGGTIGPFQHAVMFQAAGRQGLVAYWSYITSISLLEDETLTVNFSDTNGIFKII